MKLTLFEKLLIPATAAIVLVTGAYYFFRDASADGLVIVPVSQEAVLREPSAAAEPGEPDEDSRVNINEAGVSELKSLPGIGDVLAQRIIEYRELYGPFRTTAELMNIEGIGQGRYDAVKDLVRI